MSAPIGRDELRDCLTVILCGGQGQRLHPLTRDRAKPAVPFGGIYRIVDFALSNALNSGLRRIFLLTQYKSLSLDRHVREGWQLLSEALGECIVPIPPQQRLGGSWYQGTADAIFQNVYSLERERPRNVLILSGDHVYRMNYGEMLAFHREKGARLTVACIEVGPEEARHFGVAVAAEDGRITGWQEKPDDPRPVPGSPDRFLASMGVYVFDTETLVRRVSEDAKLPTEHDFGRNVIPGMLERDRVFAFPFREGGGRPYWRDIGRLDAYYEAHQDLLVPEPEFRLDDASWPIRTAPRPEPPARIVGGGAVTESLLAPGAVVTGSAVDRSVLGYGARVGRGADVAGSILFDRVTVGEGARVRFSILDKDVRVPAGCEIGFDRARDAERFVVTERGIRVVSKEMVVG